MSHQYSFKHEGRVYVVQGTYGPPPEIFTVTDLVEGATRMTRSGSDTHGTSGLKVLMADSVNTEDALRARLQRAFPGYTDFAAG